MKTRTEHNQTRTVSARRRRSIMRIVVMCATALIVVSCSTTQTKSVRPQPTGMSVKSASSSAMPEDMPVIETTSRADPGVTDVEIYPGTGDFINEKAARRVHPPVTDDGEIVLNFEAESIQSVVHTILGEVLQETFVIGPGVGGEVTFSTSKPVRRDELMPILELLLRWNGATMVFSEGRYHVLPINEAVPGHLYPTMGPAEAARGYEVRAFPLEYVAATEMGKILEPYIRPGALINADLARNMIFLAGTPEELYNYQKTIEIFDVDWLEGMSVGIYPLQTVEVDSIISELEGIFGSEGESPMAGMFRFVPLERLGSVMVITVQEEYLHKAEEWIEILDRGAAGAGKQLYVYRVKNLEAPVLAGYLSELFGGTVSQSRSSTQRGTLAPGLEPVQVGTVNDVNANRLGARNENTQNRSEDGTVGGQLGDSDIRITSVVETNSLLIQATQAEYNSVRAAIERIDIEPLQVLIESQVLNVDLTEELRYGVTWFLTNNPALVPPEVGDISRYIQTMDISGSGFGTMLATPLSGGMPFVQATIEALDTITDVRSLAAPSLLVRNNATATITVGTQVPIQSSSISTGTNNVVSSAQYVSTGTTLSVTPRINPGGLVYMDVTQDVSRPGARDPDISTSGNPPINNQTVSSQVAVQSGQTVFLAGLIQEQDNRSSGGLPYLHRIPVVGALFGAKSKSLTRSETIVMITPTVIESAVDLHEISRDMEEEFTRVEPIKITTIIQPEDDTRDYEDESLDYDE